MPETTLTLPVEALPVVAAPADAAEAAAALESDPKHASAEFAQLLAIELTPEDGQIPAAEQVMDPQLPDLEPLPAAPLGVTAGLPDGKALPPESGTPMPQSPPQTARMPDPVPAPLATLAEELPATVGTVTTKEATPVLTGPLAESSPAVLRPVTQARGQPVSQMPSHTTTNRVQPNAALPVSAAADVPESAVLSNPEVNAGEEALLVKLAEREPSPPSVYKAPGETTPPISTHGTAQPAPDLSAKEGSPASRFELPKAMRTPQWNDGLANRITWMANNQVQKAELRLNPPELGPLEVRVAVQQDETRIVFTANNAAVREAVEAALPRLRELMGSTGLNLVQVDVSAQGQDNRGQLRDWAEPAAERGEGASTVPNGTDGTTHWSRSAPHDGLFDGYA